MSDNDGKKTLGLGGSRLQSLRSRVVLLAVIPRSAQRAFLMWNWRAG